MGKLVGDVRQAASATDAEALCADIPFDLIITDIHMPTVGGLDLIRSIRRSVLNAGAVIIALSADTTSNNVEACRAAGADDFLRKPIHIPELQAIAGSRLSSQAIGA